MKTDAKEKPTAGSSGSGQNRAPGEGSSPTSLADAPSHIQDPDAPDEVRVARLATHLARREGHLGTYLVHHPNTKGEPDVEIHWVEGDHTTRVACSLPDGTVIVTGDAIYSHAPLILAGDHVMGSGFSAVEVVG